MKIFKIIILILLLYMQDTLFAENNHLNSPGMFDHLGDNLINSYTGWPSLFHLTGIGATYLLVDQDVDANIQKDARAINESTSFAYGIPGLAIGGIGPIIIPSFMYLLADDDDIDQIRGAAAAAQSVLISGTMNALLKAVSGRIPPGSSYDGSINNLSRQFRWGFMRRGIFNGWPSGHSMINMSLAATLSTYYPEKKWLWYTAYGSAFYIMTTVVWGASGNVHWFSEAVAGGLMGYAIGKTVGKSFYHDRLAHKGKINPRNETSNNWKLNLCPIIGFNRYGIIVSANY